MPPSRSKTWFVSGLHFCGSCAVTLLCWSLWILLSITLVALVYVTLAKELPVPGFVLRRIEARLAVANLQLRFGHASFDPTGKILLENVTLRVQPFEEPVVSSRLVYVRRNFWSILAGHPIPDEIRLEGATLQLPAMISPSGTVEPLVRDLALTLHHDDDNVWHVDLCTGRVGQLEVTAEGELSVPARAAGSAPLSPEEITARFLQMSRALAVNIHQLDAFDEPSLALHFDSPAGIGNTASLLFTARAAHQPWGQPITLGSLAATATLRLDTKATRPLRLHAAIHHGAYRGDFTVENLRAIITSQVALDKFSVQPPDVQLAAATLTAEGQQALGPVLHADLTHWPRVTAETAAQIQGEYIAAEVDARLKEQSARIHAEGRAAPAAISRFLEEHTPRAASYFVFGDPVGFRADAVLGPGWKFESLTSRADAGRLDSHGVKITAARGRIDIHGMSFLAYDARVALGEYGARGTYWMDFSTTDYRMLLHGRLRPPAINGWFIGDWWLSFWNSNFAFPSAVPVADVDVNGRWREPARTVYFGQADVAAATVLGGDLEQVHTVIFLRPNFTDGLELHATRAGGAERVSGTFRRLTEAATRETNRLEFNFDSNLAPETYGRMAGGKADALLAALRFSVPPQLHAQGAIEGRWPGASPNFTFTGTAANKLTAQGFPLETARVSGGIRGDELRLEEIEFAIAGGKGTGHAVLNGAPEARKLGFDANISGADLARSIRAVEDYQTARNGQKAPDSIGESKFMKRASGGRLDASLSAAGQPGEINTFTGSGNAALTGAELGEIHLFGLLSQVLSGLSLNFSSLKLDAARTSYKLEAGRLHFPDLKISGPSAVIDARGDYIFASNALDFTAKFKPFEESRNPLTAVIGIVINPITSILELKLSGPLNKPDWSIMVGPSAPKPESPAPAAPASATAKPVVPAPSATSPENSPDRKG